MENLTEIPTSEAEEFDEFRRQRRIQKVKEDIRRIVVSADKTDASTAFVKEICLAAKRLNLYGVAVNPVYVKTAKTLLSGSAVRTVAKSNGNGEGFFKTALYEIKQLNKVKADETQFLLSSSLVKNGNYLLLKRQLKKVCRCFKNKVVCVKIDGEKWSDDEWAKAYNACFQAGVRTFFVPPDAEKIERIKQLLGEECTLRSEAKNEEQFSFLSSMGVAILSCVNPDEIAGELMNKAQQG